MIAACSQTDTARSSSASTTRAAGTARTQDSAAQLADDDGQRTATSPRECDADACAIALIAVATLSDSAEPGVLPAMGRFARTAQGHFVSVDSRGRSVVIYEADGRFLKQVGTAGSGPGEFSRVGTVLPGPGDSTSVFDVSLRRLTTLDQNFAITRQVPMQHAPAIALSNGVFVVTTQVGSAERIGYPMHLANASGEIINSFGTDAPSYSPATRLWSTRIVGPASANEIWAAAPGRYVLERWDVNTLTMTKRVTIRSPWFRETAGYSDDESVRPPPQIDAIWEDGNGFVWVLFLDADSEWRAPPDANRRSEQSVSMDDRDRIYDSVLEVIDPVAQRVVASKRLRDVHWSRPPGRHVFSRNTKDLNVVAFDVWQPTVVVNQKPM